MGLGSIFTNKYETVDNGPKPELTTHYYDNAYEESKSVVLSILKDFGFNVMNVDDNYKELFLTNNHAEMIVTLYNSSFYVTSIDFTITTNYLLPFSRGQKLLKNVYDELNKKLKLKRIGGSMNA